MRATIIGLAAIGLLVLRSNLVAQQIGDSGKQVDALPSTAPLHVTDMELQLQRLEEEIKSLKRQFHATQSEVGTASYLDAQPEFSTPLEEQVQSLLEWQKSVEAADAKAATKAALKPSTKISGRIFIDSGTFDQNDASFTQVGNAQNGVQLRSAWVEVKGNVLENTTYRLWFDLAGQVSVLDAYIDIGELPIVQNFRVGHFFEPFGLEMLEPNKYLTFMERASCFNLGRNMGVMIHSDDAKANWTYGAGVFVSEQGTRPPFFQDDNDATAFTGRFTYLPWYDEASDGRGLLHVGIGYSNRTLADNNVRFRKRPDANLAPFVIDTGEINANQYQLIGLETAYAYGPFTFQAEYHATSANQLSGPSLYFDGYYMQASYFLTGENRPYNRRSGAFANRVVPLENFFRVQEEGGGICTGLGAWEVAYRFSDFDLNDENVSGGRSSLHQCGLNWYLSPYTRMMVDYIYSDTNTAVASGGQLQGVQMRFQIDY